MPPSSPSRPTLTTADGVPRVIAATVERFGGVDILVDDSGGPKPGRFAEFTDDDWLQAFAVVTLNFVRFVREVAPHMREKKWVASSGSSPAR